MEVSRGEHYAPPQAPVDDTKHALCPRCEEVAFSPEERRKVTPLRSRACRICGAVLRASWRAMLLAGLPALVLQLIWSLQSQYWFRDYQLFGVPALVWLNGVPLGVGVYFQQMLARRLPLVEVRKPSGEWPPF